MPHGTHDAQTLAVFALIPPFRTERAFPVSFGADRKPSGRAVFAARAPAVGPCVVRSVWAQRKPTHGALGALTLRLYPLVPTQRALLAVRGVGAPLVFVEPSYAAVMARRESASTLVCRVAASGTVDARFGARAQGRKAVDLRVGGRA